LNSLEKDLPSFSSMPRVSIKPIPTIGDLKI
jgi:hypothetical protein